MTGETRWVEDTATATVKVAAALVVEEENSEWQKYLDDGSGKWYHVHRETGETRWATAGDDVVVEDATESLHGHASLALPPGWIIHTDPTSKKEYYHNAASGTTSWDRPDKAALSTFMEQGAPAPLWQKYLDDASGKWWVRGPMRA